MDILLQADILLEDYTLLPGAYLGVTDGKISHLSKEKPLESPKVFRDMQGHLLLPGLYNMHSHCPMTILRGVGANLPLDRWLTEVIFPIEDKLVDEDISVGTRLAMLEFLASGVVSFTDMYGFVPAIAKEVEQAGMKANLSRPVLSFNPEDPYGENRRVLESLELYQNWHKKSEGKLLVDFAIHAEYTSHPDVVRQYAAACREQGAILHLHLSETKKEHEDCKVRHGKTPTKYFYDLGVFENPVIAAHCVWVEEEDMDILQKCGATVVHNPTSNLKLGSGIMPLTKMLEKGINVALGTDGAASNNNLNLFEEMHLAALIHKGVNHDPMLISAKTVLDMATKNGARAQGRQNAGALKVGYAADFVAINLAAPHLQPVQDVLDLLVFSAQASDVTMTMVDGKVLYENGAYPTIDTAQLWQDLDLCKKRLFDQ